jgi:Ca2+-binding EF-hand superfamily protein
MILKAADENNDGLISVQEVENLLSRIGAQDQLSKEEIETIMEGMGIQQGVGVPVSTVKAFFLPPKSA